MRLNLIRNWREAHRFWSVRFNLIGLLLLAAEQALTLWPLVPGETKALLPSWISLPFFVAALVARTIRQSKLHRAPDSRNG